MKKLFTIIALFAITIMSAQHYFTFDTALHSIDSEIQDIKSTEILVEVDQLSSDDDILFTFITEEGNTIKIRSHKSYVLKGENPGKVYESTYLYNKKSVTVIIYSSGILQIIEADGSESVLFYNDLKQTTR